ncbi:NucA/NucB deoxyribonuclease domain-containing protein [Marinobacter sediminicola]|uniref:NucA/NucB deoxyribonuclease domain-containing protein n=1 Tax=Marinobacter sediminicola TaxID=3072994 RepID=UPI003F49378B
MLTYDSRVGGSKGGRRWYKRQGGLPSCQGATPAGKSCDEYPMYRSKEGGYQRYRLGMVSLRWVNAGQNSYVGIQYGVIAKAIRSGRVKDKNVVVVTSHHLPTIGIPGSR